MFTRLKAVARAIRHRARVIQARDLHFRPDVRIPMEVHGTSYGGFAVLKDSLDADASVLSFGIGEDASFDLSLIEKYGCRVHAFDPTPKSVAWVKERVRDSRFLFHECAVSGTDGEIRLFLPKRTDFVSASIQRGTHTSEEYVDVPSRRLCTIVREMGLQRLDVVKMDIEGAEYGVLRDYLADAANPLPGQFAIEFHHFYREFGLASTRECVAGLKSHGYSLCWVSPTHHEVTFVHRSLLDESAG